VSERTCVYEVTALSTCHTRMRAHTAVHICHTALIRADRCGGVGQVRPAWGTECVCAAGKWMCPDKGWTHTLQGSCSAIGHASVIITHESMQGVW